MKTSNFKKQSSSSSKVFWILRVLTLNWVTLRQVAASSFLSATSPAQVSGPVQRLASERAPEHASNFALSCSEAAEIEELFKTARDFKTCLEIKGLDNFELWRRLLTYLICTNIEEIFTQEQSELTSFEVEVNGTATCKCDSWKVRKN